jgi:Spy/CpxP family protein refolding chaperone
MKKIIAGCLAIAAFTFSAVAQDQNNAGDRMQKDRQGMHKGHNGKGMNGMEKLNLNDAQKQQIKSINEEFKTKIQGLNKNDNMMVKDMKAQKKALMQERKNKIAAILTPEQKNQFAQLHKERNKGDWKNKSKGEDWKKKRKMEDGKEKVKVKTT